MNFHDSYFSIHYINDIIIMGFENISCWWWWWRWSNSITIIIIMCIRTGESIYLLRDLDQMRFAFIIPISPNEWEWWRCPCSIFEKSIYIHVYMVFSKDDKDALVFYIIYSTYIFHGCRTIRRCDSLINMLILLFTSGVLFVVLYACGTAMCIFWFLRHIKYSSARLMHCNCQANVKKVIIIIKFIRLPTEFTCIHVCIHSYTRIFGNVIIDNVIANFSTLCVLVFDFAFSKSK